MPFNLFGKKEEHSTGVFIDKTYISTTAKMNACLALAKEKPSTLFICWFADTARKFKEFFRQHGIDEAMITEASYVHASMFDHKLPVFAEHYPIHSKEMELVKQWPVNKIVVYSAMDEPLFKHFGSDKMIPLMKMLGMKEEEAIEHSFVTKSIIKGQDKMAKQVGAEQLANSQGEWMEKNIKN